MRNTSFIVHTKPPTIRHKSPRGTIWKVAIKTPAYFIQVKRDGLPEWVPLGIMLERSLGDFWIDEKLIQRCLEIYTLKEKS